MKEEAMSGGPFSGEETAFLRGVASAAVDSATIDPGESARAKSGEPIGLPNGLDFPAIRPGGRACYPAIWVQDFTMTFACGLVPMGTGRAHLRCIAGCQNGAEDRPLRQAHIPPFAVPDHVNLDGGAVFFPGTYDSGPGQGGEPYGARPPFNNHFDFIWLAWLCARHGTDGRALLRGAIDAMPLVERLQRAFDAVPAEEDTGLVCTRAEDRGVGFIFCDSIYMTGRLLMASLLRHRAAGQLADLYRLLGDEGPVERLKEEQRKIVGAIPRNFAPAIGRGWLRASTGVSSQEHVWATVFALHRGVLTGETKAAAEAQIVEAVRDGTILYQGAVRHVPTDGNASAETTWERAVSAHNRYQNGAYWHMPTGWLLSALSGIDPALAGEVGQAFVRHMRDHDLRRGQTYGAPWECIGPEEEAWQNDAFLPSITMPLAVLAPGWASGEGSDA